MQHFDSEHIYNIISQTKALMLITSTVLLRM